MYKVHVKFGDVAQLIIKGVQMSWLTLNKKRNKTKWLQPTTPAPMREDFPFSYPYERSYGSPYAGPTGEPNLSVGKDVGIKSDPEHYVYLTRMVQ